MADADPVMAGGCLCGRLRWSASAAPQSGGYCCCADCRKASGSGFIPFMRFLAADVEIAGEASAVRSPALSGREAVRNFCPACGGLVFGGVVGVSDRYTIYAGSLDDASAFAPTMAIFERDRPAWVVLPPGLTVFPALPS
jgi:hypothetical protein